MSFQRVTIIFLLSLCFGTSHAQDIPVNPNLVWNGENSLAVNPADSNNLVVAWMKLTGLRVSIAVSASFDGGSTWSTPVNQPHFYVNSTSADPTICFRNDGTVFLAYIDYHLNHDTGAVYVTQSADGGLTWSPPVEVINGFATADWPVDRPWLVVDNSASATQGTLHLVSKSVKDAPFPHAIWHVASTDSGATWSAPELVDDSIPIGPGSSSMAVPAVGPDGTFYVLYLSYNPIQFLQARYVLAKKTGAAAGFTYSTVTTLPLASFFPATDSLYQYSYHVAANPADSLNLLVVWTDYRNGDPDIFSVRSADGGATWSPALRVNDDTVGNGAGQDMCWAAFSTGGRYAAAWRDRRNGGAGQNADYRIFGAASFDGGLTFTASGAVGAQGGPLFIPVDGNDFLGVSATEGKIIATWTDQRNTRNQLYFNFLSMVSLVTGVASPLLPVSRLKLFPNPSSCGYVETGCDGLQRILICDVTGRTLRSIDIGAGQVRCRITTAGLTAGVYLLRAITTHGASVSGKFVVN